jgi:hypothetical protein
VIAYEPKTGISSSYIYYLLLMIPAKNGSSNERKKYGLKGARRAPQFSKR